MGLPTSMRTMPTGERQRRPSPAPVLAWKSVPSNASPESKNAAMPQSLVK
jgi:hypothetical protein